MAVDDYGTEVLKKAAEYVTDGDKSDYVLKTSIGGVDYIEGKSGVDAGTESLQSITFEHHTIHAGKHFFLSMFDTYASGQVVDYTVITPNTTTWAHMAFAIGGSQAHSIKIYEGATVDTLGTVVTPNNNNRNSATLSTLVIREGDTFTAEGTMLSSSYGGAQREVGSIAREREIMLKQNTTYIFRITNETNQENVIDANAEWYEHASKN